MALDISDQRAVVFVTANLRQRGAFDLTEEVHHLRNAFLRAKRRYDFECLAFVALPDHFHGVMRTGDADAVLGEITERFEMALRTTAIWDRETLTRPLGDDDVDGHIASCWANPIKHDHVDYAFDWDFSSIHRDARDNRVDRDLWDTIHPTEFGLFRPQDMPPTGARP